MLFVEIVVVAALRAFSTADAVSLGISAILRTSDRTVRLLTSLSVLLTNFSSVRSDFFFLRT